MRSLVIGLGRSGAHLHLPVLLRLRRTAPGLITDGPIIGCDPAGPGTAELTWTATVEQAARLLDPGHTVAHVCTPPATRVRILTELAACGFRNIVVEKPLAVDEDDLAEILRLRQHHGLRLAVVAPWLASTLTRRLVRLVRGGRLGPLRSLSVVQSKPRFRRSLAAACHPTAFDVELPHSVGVALYLAGGAEVTAASCTDLVLDGRRAPHMGGAEVRLRHATGVDTRLRSDLAAPVRERRVTLRFEQGTATGHYAIGADDDHAQLAVSTGGGFEHAVLPDDSLGTFLLDAYRGFAEPGDVRPADLELAAEVVRVLTAAKSHAGVERLATAGRTEHGVR
ncbi:oxidoreductase [Actinophytocola sp.]|uniref:oxidoreductase n=1 Tax=Actinophytocola sp. TaxID=1872138 RepID=UPI003D6B78FD